jgi:endo-1,4-beta-xylanase
LKFNKRLQNSCFITIIMGVLSHLVSISAIAAAVSAAPAPPASQPASFVLRGGDSALSRRAQSVNYNQDYVAGGANVQYSPNQGAGSFSISYNTNADFVVGLGWQPGDSK